MLNIYSRLAVSCDVTVVTPVWPDHEAFDSKHVIRIVRSPRVPVLNDRHGAPFLGMFFWAIKEVLLNRPDQIHCDQIETAALGRILAIIFHVPYFVYAYAMEVTDQNRVRLKRWAARKAATVVAISQYTLAQVRGTWGISVSRIRLIHPGVDIKRFHPRVDATKIRAQHNLVGKKVILTIGRLAAGEQYKGQDQVIRCMPKILASVPNALYLIVGDGPDRTRLEALVKALHLEEQVAFAGAVVDERLPEYYAASTVFVMASKEGRNKRGGVITEGFGMVFIEASASGRPVIGTRVGGIPDAITEGITGRLVAPDDEQELAQAIIDLLQNQQYAERMGKAGRACIERAYQWDAAVQKVAQLVTAQGSETRLDTRTETR